MKWAERIDRAIARRGAIGLALSLIILLTVVVVGGVAAFHCIEMLSRSTFRDIVGDVGVRFDAICAVAWLVFWLATVWVLVKELKQLLW